MFVRSLLQKEIVYFRAFPSSQKRLLASFFFYALAAPVVTIFNNTFVWRQTQNPIDIALYNLGIFSGIALGFYFNLFWRRYFSSSKLYAFGCLLQGLAPILLIFFQPQNGITIGLAGLFLGVAMGFFWANRNTLTSEATVGPHRFVFVSVETVMNSLIGIFMPILVGTFLVLGEKAGWYSVQTSYEIIGLGSFCFLLVAGFITWRSSFSAERLRHLRLFIQNPTSLWKKLRFMEVISGFVHGFEVLLPLLFILTFLGLEDTVGIVKSATAIVAALCMYVLGKMVRHKDHAKLLFVWLLGTFLAAAVFAVFFNAQGVVIYFMLFGLVSAFRWPSLVTTMYECVDFQLKKNNVNRFSLLLDRELFLNIGRMLAISLFIIVYHAFPMITLRFGMLVLVLVELVLYFSAKEIILHVAHLHDDKNIILEESL